MLPNGGTAYTYLIPPPGSGGRRKILQHHAGILGKATKEPANLEELGEEYASRWPGKETPGSLGDFDVVYGGRVEHIQRKSNPGATSVLGRTKGGVLAKYTSLVKTIVASRLLLTGAEIEEMAKMSPMQLIKAGIAGPIRAHFYGRTEPRPKKRYGSGGLPSECPRWRIISGSSSLGGQVGRMLYSPQNNAEIAR